MLKHEKKILKYANTLEEFNQHNGIILTQIDVDFAECAVNLTEDSFDENGHVHNGLLFAIADVVTGFAAFSTYRPCVTAGASLNFFRPATGSFIRAEGITVDSGEKLATVIGNVYDDGGVLVASGIFTYCFMEKKK